MRIFRFAIALGILAPICLSLPASAMSRQAPPKNANGTSQLVDPDEAIEQMLDHQRAAYSHRYRSFSDSSWEARDAVQSQAAPHMSIPFH